MSTRVPLAHCQRRLALLWLPASAILFALLIAQSLFGKYGDQSGKAWSWFLPTVLPTLSLIVGAVAYSARQEATTDTVEQFAYRLSIGLSVFYLALVAAVPLIQPLTSAQPFEVMESSKLWLAPLQGLLGLALGAFFVSRQSAR